MPGAEKLKADCFKCKVNKWAVDFKEGAYANISSTSVCLSCEQAALIEEQIKKIEAQKKEVDRLKIKEKEQDEMIRKLVEHVSKMEQRILETDRKKLKV